ncbi:ABC transporter ATP-binding protein [Alphaproteobacteria bacterium]|nr:ABC transporter ATP-binding protein [Alphaproteobacteria bacterium]MDA9164719.1 ABC transporter ATP-binding protein [Alphaproteobacteria bacterium]MDB2387853.1 ABC transporter ATP-binding protein [Alphaproteobacteria bacterium]MDB2479101.1 ABC transporter ATP-binding protein [Alphaproteobacteria bacterium]
MPNKNSIEVRNLVKTYGDVYALKNVDLDIADGEYFVLLGPSGGGKTTLLRSIGGFIRPDSGTVQIKGKNVDNLPPDKRPTSMVFQGFALFPHMTVYENIGYGLKLRSVEKSIIHDRVIKMMDLVGLSGLSDRKPHELSGGQQQRVQLARALILENDVLLLDEPLSALDAQLRKDMCIELKRLQKTVGISFVHVTHNQEEAMSVADRIAIIADGEMVEQGSPKEIYSNPKKKFTAEFIGEKNILNGVVVDFNKSKILVNIEKDEIEVANNNYTIAKNQEISLSIKSESIQISKVSSSKSKGAKNSITGKVTEITFLGQFIRYLVLLSNNQEIQVRSNNEVEGVSLNDQINLTWSLDDFLIHES